jgi:hypothetical protein
LAAVASFLSARSNSAAVNASSTTMESHMKPAVLLCALASALPLTLAAGPAAAADACKNVKFNVTNNHFEGRDIEIRKIRFTNPHNDGKEQTENVKNKVCKPASTCTTDGDNLANADKVDLRAIKVVFAYREHDGQWSKEFVTQPFTPAYPKCSENKKYGPIVVRDSD